MVVIGQMFFGANYLTIKMAIIKVCGDPHCEAIYHNIQKKDTRCNDCNGWLKMINESTYWKKYSTNYFQFDYYTMEFFYPIKPI